MESVRPPVDPPPAPACRLPAAGGREPARPPEPRGRLGRLVHWLEQPVGRMPFRAHRVRKLVQWGFALWCLLAGYQFHRFVRAARAGELPLPHRPPGVEGFLPISGLMGLLDWIYRGTLNRVHPAATIVFLVVVATALLLRKGFCGWVCPIGLLSELLARLGHRLTGRLFVPWRPLDLALRSLKYLLFAFFFWAVLSMDPAELAAWIEGPYNRVADIKMYLFFAEIGRTAALTLGFLALASLFVRQFWCRYLCPYGALLGLLAWFSPFRVHRSEGGCTLCHGCDTVCMARIPVSRRRVVDDRLCSGCLDCLVACPGNDALHFGTARRRIRPVVYALLIVGMFLGGWAVAELAGAWRNGIPDREYVERVREIDSPLYMHPGG